MRAGKIGRVFAVKVVGGFGGVDGGAFGGGAGSRGAGDRRLGGGGLRGDVFGVGFVGEGSGGARGFPVAVAALVRILGDEALVVCSVVGVAVVACGVDATCVFDFDRVVECLVVVDLFGRKTSEFLVNGGGGALEEGAVLGARLPLTNVLDHLASTVLGAARRHDALALVFR